MSVNYEEVSRVERSKTQAKRNYDRFSRLYDFLAFPERVHKLAGLRKLDLKPGEKVLEIGFGTGICIKKMARSIASSGEVHGIDISEGMYKVTRKKLRKAKLEDRVNLIIGDATSLPFSDKSFDAVFMSFTLELFDNPDISRVIKECKRVLNENGRICVVSLTQREKNNIITRLYKWAHESFPAIVDCRPIYPKRSLKSEGFRIAEDTLHSMIGIPVRIVLAKV